MSNEATNQSIKGVAAAPADTATHPLFMDRLGTTVKLEHKMGVVRKDSGIAVFTMKGCVKIWLWWKYM